MRCVVVRVGLFAIGLAAVLALSAGCKKDAGTTGAKPSPTPASQAAAVDDGLTPEVLAGQTVAGEGRPSADTGLWNQFRGPNRDNIAAQSGPLARSWPDGKPKELWAIDGLGIGYAGPAVCGGKVYFHDYDDTAKRWVIRCVSLADGKDIWRWSYSRLIRESHGITRTVPAVDEKYVISLDPKGVLHGLDAVTGRQLWVHNLPAEFNDTGLIPQWYNGQCPLQDGPRVVLGIGSVKADILMAAFDKASGNMVWKTPNPNKHKMAHASVMPMTLNGRSQFVWCTEKKGLVGVDAANGTILWELPWAASSTAVAPSPVQVGPNRVFMTSGYKAGAILAEVAEAGGRFTPSVVTTLTWPTFESDCHTPVLWQDHLYVVNNGTKKGKLACLDLEGKILWEQESPQGFGLGPYLLADGLLVALESGGMLRLIDPSPAGYKELAAAKVLPGHDAWAPMACVNGKLICRDMNRMVCLQVGP